MTSGILEKIENLDVRWVFPGHGEFMDDLKGIIATYRDHHRQRKNLVEQALEKKPRSVFDLIDEIFPALPDTELFLAASDIWAHLELLLDEGHVVLVDSGPPEIYAAA